MADGITAHSAPLVTLDGVSVVYGTGAEQLEAIRRVTFSVQAGEIVCLLGTSGCGKTTILNTIGGFLRPSRGRVLIDGNPVSEPGLDRGMVFQKHALFPWKTVQGNIEFGLKSKGLPRKERRRISGKLIEEVRLQGFESMYPAELSGGMEQRVGLARTLATDPKVLLMDEPFGALDAQTRMTMQQLLLEIWRAHGKTIVFVTHDVDEAVLLGDRVIVLTARPGTVKEEIRVESTRPRTYETLATDEFVSIRQRALRLICEESAESMARAPCD